MYRCITVVLLMFYHFWFLILLCSYVIIFFFFLMIRRPPRSTRTDTLFPYTTLFRSGWDGYFGGVIGANDAVEDKPSAAPVHLVLDGTGHRSEEHTSELQSLMRISYAVFCLKKKKKQQNKALKHKQNNTTTTITLSNRINNRTNIEVTRTSTTRH